MSFDVRHEPPVTRRANFVGKCSNNHMERPAPYVLRLVGRPQERLPATLSEHIICVSAQPKSAVRTKAIDLNE